MNALKCLFCLNELHDGIEMMVTANALEIIHKHFWTELFTEAESMACFDCWHQVESFHQFYVKVETNHKQCDSINEEAIQMMLDEKVLNNSQENAMSFATGVLQDNHSADMIECLTESSIKAERDEFLTDPEENATSFDDEYVELDATEFDTEAANADVKMIGLQIDILTAGDEYLSQMSDDDASHNELNEEFNDQFIDGSIGEVISESFTGSQYKPPKREDNRLLASEVKVFSADPKTKRKRGRPPKYVPRQYHNLVIPKTSRGRPRKIRPQIDRIECFMCRETCESFQLLRVHTRLHDPDGYIFPCLICSRTFDEERTLGIHLRGVHQYSKTHHIAACPICNKRMKYRCLKQHIAEVHEYSRRCSLEYVCEVCGKACASQASYMQHESTHLSDELTKVQCEICNKWLKNEQNLRAHKQTHDNNQVKCPHCDKVKSNMSQLKSHIYLMHTKRKHACQICGKSFNRPILLKEHIALHTGETLYNCSYCPKTFKSNANMYKHLRDGHAEDWQRDRHAAKRN